MDDLIESIEVLKLRGIEPKYIVSELLRLESITKEEANKILESLK